MDTSSSAPVPAPAMQKPSWGTLALGSFAEPERAQFIRRVYAWMCGGLLVSAAVSLWVAVTPPVALFILGNSIVFWGLLILELVCVFYIAKKVHTISSIASAAIFLLYSALNGLTFSVIFFVYQFSSIVQVFVITAGMFGALSLYGYTTKRDLTGIGAFAIMALFGLVAAMLVNFFWQNDTAGFVLAAVGVLVFTVLTAYDTQKLKWLYELGRTEGADGEAKESVNGALTLYLDFINLFLDLLRLMGRRR